jgi:hypothetical protein
VVSEIILKGALTAVSAMARGASLLSDKKTRLDVDVTQVVATQFRGRPCLLFYVLRFVNTTDENVTVKEIVLRLKGRHDVDSTVLVTGQVESPKGYRSESIVLQFKSPPKNIFLSGWKNLRPVLGEYKALSPGAVLAGSAAYVIDNMTVDQLRQLTTIEMVAVDFAGNETTKQIDLDPEWLKLSNSSVVEREFLRTGQEMIWK